MFNIIFAVKHNRGYRFAYDGLNRLTDALYGEADFTKHDNRYNEQVLLYSANGMARRLQRRGLKSDGKYGKIDNLHITLDGNRPLSIADDADPQTHYGAFEFSDGASLQTEYTYNSAGALVSDANKGIAHISYDNFGYPREVQFTGGHLVRYVYSPTGQKLRTTYVTAVDNLVVPLGTTLQLTNAQIVDSYSRDYCGSTLYERGALSKHRFPGGYATFPSATTSALHNQSPLLATPRDGSHCSLLLRLQRYGEIASFASLVQPRWNPKTRSSCATEGCGDALRPPTSSRNFM